MLNFPILFLASFVTLTTATLDRHQEELKVVPIANDYVNTFFNFESTWHFGGKRNMPQTNLEAREVFDFIRYYNIKELHFSMTRGFWMYNSWGYPIAGAPNGFEAWAWFDGKNLNDSNIDRNWIRVMKEVASILCLNINVEGRTISPKYGYPFKFISADPNENYHIRYIMSPFVKLENENLRSWKKLLPCGWTHGLASLLTLKNIEKMKYISLSFDMVTLCYRKKECSLQVTQTANLVLDLKLFQGNSNEYSLARLFDHGFSGHCELSTTSMIHLQSNNDTNIAIPYKKNEDESTAISSKWLSQGQYDVAIQSADFFDRMCLKYTPNDRKVTKRKKYLVHANRSISGDIEHGYQIYSEIINSYNVPVPFLAFETYPWFVEVNINSLNIAVQFNNDNINPKILLYIPAGKESHLHQLNTGLILKPKSITTIKLTITIQNTNWITFFSPYTENLISSSYSALLPFGNNYRKMPNEGNRTSDLFNATLVGGYYQLIYWDQIAVKEPERFNYILNKTWVILCTIVVTIAIGVFINTPQLRQIIKYF